MRLSCVVALLISGASGEISGCAVNPDGSHTCDGTIPTGDATSFFQLRKHEFATASQSQTATLTRRCLHDVVDDEHDCKTEEWGSWGDCSASCGDGTRSRSRKGCGCVEEKETCTNGPCPVDCTFTEWKDWADCSKTCGGGTRNRSRKVTLAPHDPGMCGCVEEAQSCSTTACFPLIDEICSDGSWPPCLPEEVATTTTATTTMTTTTTTTTSPEQTVVVRKEVRELSDAEAERFIKAWKELMVMGEMKRLAHIHGITKIKGQTICVHGHENFAGWHRIYLADLEKALQKADLKLNGDGRIALPYWDWQRISIKGQVLPNIIRKAFIDNPLDDTVKAFYEAECQRCKGLQWTNGACGQGWDCSRLLSETEVGLPDTKNEQDLAETLESANLNAKVEELMKQTSHACLAGKDVASEHDCTFGSLEDAHDLVHMAIGWPMWSFSHAPYNPIFFLHHNNIDRLYESWLQAHPKAKDDIKPKVLNTKYVPWKLGLSGALEGKPHQYSLSDCWDIEALGYKFDSLLDGTKITGTQFLQGTASGRAVVIFPAVDFFKLDSLNIEVAVVPQGTNVSLAGMQGKTFHQRKSVYGAGFCGLVGIFSKVGMGHVEPKEVDCTAAMNKLNITDVTKLDVVYFCATDLWPPEEGLTDRVQECSDAISPPTLRDGAMEMTGMAMAQHTEHSH